MTSHGLGHASRVSAVLQQLSKEFAALEVWLAGETPDWFWEMNLPQNCTFKLYNEVTDIGLVQVGPFKHEVKVTLERVLDFISFRDNSLSSVIAEIKKLQPHFILSDISPMGIKVGQLLDIPTILMENFTWDWIYQPFLDEEKQFEEVIATLKQIYSSANMRLQCTPFCQVVEGTTKLNPIYRASQEERKYIFGRLGIDEDQKFILVTTGGISMQHSFREVAEDHFLVVPGDFNGVTTNNQTIYLPMNTEIPFQDLVKVASCVVGKAGYGTVSECWGMNTPFIGVFRDSFRESSVLRKFCKQNLAFEEISLASFHDGTWANLLPTLLASSHEMMSVKRVNGASQASSEIIKFLFL